MLEHLEMLKNGRVSSLEAHSHTVDEFLQFLSNPCVWALPRYLRCQVSLCGQQQIMMRAKHVVSYYYIWRVLIIHTEYDIRLWEYINFMIDDHGQQAAGNMA